MARRNNTARKIEANIVEAVVETIIDNEVQQEEVVTETEELVTEAVAEEPVTVERKMETVEELVAMGHKTKSDQIRYLYSMGHKAGPISKQLNIIYQHAYNVIKKPLKRVSNTAEG